jgi:thiol-disulfide isomerase/thioredoxin
VDAHRLPEPLATGERAYVGQLGWGQLYTVMTIESPAKQVVYLASLDGGFTAADSHAFVEEGQELVAAWRRPLPPGGFIDRAPMRFVSGPGHTLEFIAFVAEGSVEIDGAPTRFRFSIQPATGKLSKRMFNVDADGDGKFALGSPRENIVARKDGSPSVFRVGRRYLAVETIDDTGRFVVGEHPAGDYLLEEPEVGKPMRDFEVVDLEGRRHRLSDNRGKYVLLHIWATTCHFCEEEAEGLASLYEKLNGKVAILGLNQDDELAPVKSFLAKHPPQWPEASSAMKGSEVGALLDDRLAIRALPSAILLDPRGNVAVLDARRLRARDLEATFAGLP